MGIGGGCGRGSLTVVLAIALAGCGSRSGLDVPDSSFDFGVDAGTDQGPDAGPPPPPCVEVTPGDGVVPASLEIPASLAVVDIMFLIDSTGSMEDEIDAVRAGLRDRVVPGVRAIIPDAAFGVALYGEFPVAPHGPRSVEPYELRTPITQDVPLIESSLDAPESWGNFDDAEAGIEGLYQVMTGAGYGAPGTPGFIPASPGCAAGGTGGACFRAEAQPIVMLITDAPFHNGPPGLDERPYSFEPPPATYRQAIDATRSVGALVLGLWARDFGSPAPVEHIRQLLLDTGSVDVNDDPLEFPIGSGGNRIGDDIIEAVERVAEGVPLDVTAFAEDQPGDVVDASVVLRGVRAASASPPGNVERIEAERFVQVVPGTRLTFEILVSADDLAPSPERRVFPIRVTFRASGSRLEEQRLDIVVPGDDGLGCDVTGS